LAASFISSEAMSAIGTKQASPNALHMSAFDPKQTSAEHCGNVFDAGFNPYQSAHVNR
jgi:hypothetical protein